MLGSLVNKRNEIIQHLWKQHEKGMGVLDTTRKEHSRMQNISGGGMQALQPEFLVSIHHSFVGCLEKVTQCSAVPQFSLT